MYKGQRVIEKKKGISVFCEAKTNILKKRISKVGGLGEQNLRR